MLVTVEDLLGKEVLKDERKKIKVFVKELDGELEIDLLTKEDYLDFILENHKDADCDLVYQSCPIFRDQKLLEKFKCTFEPSLVVAKLLSGGAIMKLAQIIIDKSGFNPKDFAVKVVDEEIKN